MYRDRLMRGPGRQGNAMFTRAEKNVLFLYTHDCSRGNSYLCGINFGDYHISDNVCLVRKQKWRRQGTEEDIGRI